VVLLGIVFLLFIMLLVVGGLTVELFNNPTALVIVILTITTLYFHYKIQENRKTREREERNRIYREYLLSKKTERALSINNKALRGSFDSKEGFLSIPRLGLLYMRVRREG
jgi:Ca2+/Na+ antiporter